MAVLPALLAIAAPAQATFPGSNGKIAFAGDADGDYEIYTVNPDGSDLRQLTHNAVEDRDPAWSADGRYIAFTRDGAINAMDESGANQTEVYPSGRDPQWSPNGALAFAAGPATILEIDPGGDQRVVYGGSDFLHTFESISDLDRSSLDRTVFSGAQSGQSADLFVVHSPAGNPTYTTALAAAPGDEVNVSWEPSQAAVAYARQGAGAGNDGIWRWHFCCQIPVQVTSNQDDDFAAWSPDGSKIAVSGESAGADISVMDVDGSNRTPVTNSPATTELEPEWQRTPSQQPDAHIRPKGASPIRVSLVPAYRSCDEPNSDHAPPLAFPSCSPPVQASDYLTVGTADSNGQPTKSIGWVRLGTVRGNPATPEDEADMRVTASISDVRCKVAQVDPCGGESLADYTGDLQLAMDARVTDQRVNYFNQREHLTMTDIYRFPVTFSCAATADTTVGSTCALSTSIDALYSGAITEGARAIWQLGHVEVRDGGEDGSASSDDYTIFATQGVFVP